MLEVGKKYSSAEIAREVFNISAKTFSNNRTSYLERMSNYYE